MADEKITLDGAEAVYSDDWDEGTYRASIVTAHSIRPAGDGLPTALDLTKPGYKCLNMTASLDQFDEKIEADRATNAVELAAALVANGIQAEVSGNIPGAAISDEIKEAFRRRYQRPLISRINRIRREARFKDACFLFLYEATLPKGEKPGTYRIEETENRLTFTDRKPTWIPTVTSAEEKTTEELLDDPFLFLKKSKVIGKRLTAAAPFDTIDADPALKKRALSLLTDAEGGLQPIWRIEHGNLKSLAATEETDAGLHIKGIGQVIRITGFKQVFQPDGQLTPNYFSWIYDADYNPEPPQWAAFLTDLGADPV